MLTEEVERAVADIRVAFSTARVDVVEDGEGGAYVVVEPVDLGPPYVQDTSWCGFRIGFQYPDADVYPHFIRPDLARIDRAPLRAPLSPAPFQGRPAIQVSRRSNRLDSSHQTAVLKLLKVIEWLRAQ